MKPKPEKETPWSDCSTLEEWAEKMIREGETEVVAALIRVLPEEKKEKYREIWKRISAEKRSGK